MNKKIAEAGPEPAQSFTTSSQISCKNAINSSKISLLDVIDQSPVLGIGYFDSKSWAELGRLYWALWNLWNFCNFPLLSTAPPTYTPLPVSNAGAIYPLTINRAKCNQAGYGEMSQKEIPTEPGKKEPLGQWEESSKNVSFGQLYYQAVFALIMTY